MSVFWSRTSVAASAERRSFFPGFISSAPSSYADINLAESEASLQKVAVWSAVDLITSLASELPVDVYRGRGSDRTLVASGHPWLDDPGGDGYGREDWVAKLVISWLLRGNAFGIEHAHNERGQRFPTAIELLHPDRVSASIVDGRPKFRAPFGEIPENRAFHNRVYPIPGELLGMSPIGRHATTIGQGIAIDRFGYQWFKDGAHPDGMLVNSERDLDQKQSDTAKARFLAALRGKREPVVLGKGWTYEQLQINPNESQFLESNQFSSAECARIFGPGIAEVLGYETGGSMTYSNIESRFTHLLVLTLNKWFRRVDRVLTMMLPAGQYARINRDAMLQSTTLERFKAHEIALRNRWEVVNEVRELEELPPVDWGDEPNPVAGAPADPVLEDQDEDDDSGTNNSGTGGNQP